MDKAIEGYIEVGDVLELLEADGSDDLRAELAEVCAPDRVLSAEDVQEKHRAQKKREEQDEKNAKRDKKIAFAAASAAANAACASASLTTAAAVMGADRSTQLLGNLLYQVVTKIDMELDTYLSWLKSEVGFTDEELQVMSDAGLLHEEFATEEREM